MRIDIFRTQLVKEKGINYEAKQIIDTDDAYHLFCDLFHMNEAPQEECYMMCLNAKARVVGMHLISMGDISSSIVHPRNIFQRALLNNAYGIILAHNHPSGDPAPSEEDRILTKRLDEAGTLLGIQFVDHIVIGSDKYYSFRAEGQL